MFAHDLGAESILRMCKAVLDEGNRGGYPWRLIDQIREALENGKTSADMTAQLATLVELRPLFDDAQAMRLVNGKLIYQVGDHTVAWGRTVFKQEHGERILGRVAVVGGKPCWATSDRLKCRVYLGGAIFREHHEHAWHLNADDDRVLEVDGLPLYVLGPTKILDGVEVIVKRVVHGDKTYEPTDDLTKLDWFGGHTRPSDEVLHALRIV